MSAPLPRPDRSGPASEPNDPTPVPVGASTGPSTGPSTAASPSDATAPDPSAFVTRIDDEAAPGRRFVVRLERAVPEAERAATGARIAAAASLDARRVARLLAKTPGAPLIRPVELETATRVQRLFESAGVATAVEPEARQRDIAHAFREAARTRRRNAAEAARRADAAAARRRRLATGVALVALFGALLGALLPAFGSPPASYLALPEGGAGAALLAALAAFALIASRRAVGAMAMAGAGILVVGVDLARLVAGGGTPLWPGWTTLIGALALALTAAAYARSGGR